MPTGLTSPLNGPTEVSPRGEDPGSDDIRSLAPTCSPGKDEGGKEGHGVSPERDRAGGAGSSPSSSCSSSSSPSGDSTSASRPAAEPGPDGEDAEEAREYVGVGLAPPVVFPLKRKRHPVVKRVRFSPY
ncbi:hypothetical protein VTH06DRAFT_4221 [Thermothelomyces fergusii]